MSDTPAEASRRQFLRAAACGSAGLAGWAILRDQPAARAGTAPRQVRRGPASQDLDLASGWRFGPWADGAGAVGYDDSALPAVDLPHGLTRLSWDNWDPSTWQSQWLFRRHFSLPAPARRMRVFLEFRGAMGAATPWLNGTALPRHLGGYLPFSFELTDLVRPGDNVLAVDVDDTWAWQVPPQGNPTGPTAIDFYQPGGIYRPVRIRTVPQVFLSDVYAKPVNVLSPSRSLDVTVTVDAAAPVPAGARVDVVLSQGKRVVATAVQAMPIPAGTTTATLTLSRLAGVRLWDVDSPALYDVRAILSIGGVPVHEYSVRTGFRDARFELDGFFLNGRRLTLFGLSRHQLYPFAGVAQPDRVQRRDAEILRNELNCTIVRCSHYPQADAFLDACDELGLMVWEELPGWHYVGDAGWQDLAVRDVTDMVQRDRSRPSVVIWGVRVNESPVSSETAALYARTTQAARALDDARPTSGAMDEHSTADWSEDVFAFNDYTRTPAGAVALQDPIPGYPYLVTEAVGQYDYAGGTGFDQHYQRTSSAAVQERQASLHAQAHELGAGNDRYCGVIGWAAFDYQSGHGSVTDGVKYAGVCDMFRLPKLGASIYRAQVDPRLRPVIAPAFYWDFGADFTPGGPGADAMICSNCDSLQVFVGGAYRTTVTPDVARFGHLAFPPSFADLATDPSSLPDLRIDGFLGGRRIISRSFSADHALDQLAVAADDPEIDAGGSDATRVTFAVVDRYGAARPALTGPDV
ncbi:MAG TPA: glycoside hydrolase family 2 TIM barrel-domain containing protein, partial [Streptosporangiaceae bacterium]|nr:glycoside hydrolase family 2 TIM barrel-domain containing protein [Streptosporangiaceae bacterium]